MDYIGFDIGKKTVRFIKNNKLQTDEYVCLAYNAQNKVIAIGNEALSLYGTRRLKFDLQLKELFILLDAILEKFHVFHLFRKVCVIFTLPSTYSEAEIDKIKTYFYHRGASQVFYEAENLCAALGSHLNIYAPCCACLLHIGYQQASLNLFHSGKVLKEAHISYGAHHINLQIKGWIQSKYHFQVSDQAIEEIKTKIGQCQYVSNPRKIRVPGTDFTSQQLKYLELNENQMVDLLQPFIYLWAKWIYAFLSDLNLNQQEEILERGIVCCGPTMKIDHLLDSLQAQLSLPFSLALNASECTSMGLSLLIEEKEKK